MKDEIKQMLDNLKFISEQESATIEINQNGCKVILDCITNLQEENETLRKQEKVASDMSKEYYMKNKKARNFLKHLRNTFDKTDEMYELLDNAIGLLNSGDDNGQ